MMEIRQSNNNKFLSIPFSVNFTDDKEDLIRGWVNTEGSGNVNPIVDFEVDLYQNEKDKVSFDFKFFCCGDNSGDETTNPFYPYYKQNIFTKSTGYFINSYANTLRDVSNLSPVSNQIIGKNIDGTNDWLVDVGGGNIKKVREVNVLPISNAAMSNSQFIFTYFNDNNIINRKQINKILINGKTTSVGYDPFYFNKLIFTGDTGQTSFNLVGYNAINYSSVLKIAPNLGNVLNPPKGVTFDNVRIPNLSLDKFNKTLGNNLYIPKSSDVSEMFLQISFYNPKTGKSIQMVTKSGGTINDILNINGDGTIFYRTQYNEKYSYIKLLLSSSTKTYGFRLYNPNTDSYDINPIVSGNTVIPMYEKIITDVRVTNQASPKIPLPSAS